MFTEKKCEASELISRICVDAEVMECIALMWRKKLVETFAKE